ncbi:hypothetical protein N7495_004829 [Penicillium taxi]|uniref:uncharacterized protein n=1 Tax=Penicillium taxi TaxID=168475 RepID=UPI002545B5A5|nr:uncharacterized protein N7495_004829 [Penicillium taxi]KAJ5900085.1 hypothetical protein N7495_004829 [Penicillium taxi]
MSPKTLALLQLRQLTRGLTGAASRSFVTTAKCARASRTENSLISRLLDTTELNDSNEIGKVRKKNGNSVKGYNINKFNKHNPTTLETTEPASALVEYDKTTLQYPQRDDLNLPHYYLRDLCKCVQCVDPHSKQRSFRTNDIPEDIYPREVKWDGEDLQVSWKNDIPGYNEEHVSRWNWRDLAAPAWDTHDHTSWDMAPLKWSSDIMHKLQHWVSYEDYMNDDAKFASAMRNIQRLGLLFVKDIPKSREMVEKIATRMGPLRNSFYGSTWDVRTVPEAKNVAYTNQFLGFHMDLMYMNEPPAYQLLHCLENSCDGGESLFADSFYAAQLMKTHCLTEFKTLTRTQLSYEYVHEDQTYYNTWPVIELNEKTKEVHRVNYSPPFQSALPGGGKGVESFALMKRALDLFTSQIESQSSVYQLKLKPGECVIFANRRIVHARNQFSTATGSRWLAGAYVDEDAVLSRFAVSRKKNPAEWIMNDPFNSSH